MDNQTRYGIGGLSLTPLFTFLALAYPSMPILISIVGIVISLSVAIWGFWPIVQKRFALNKKLSLEPIYKAIAHVAKRTNDNDEPRCWEKTRLAIRQAAFDDKIKIYGFKSNHIQESPGGWSMVRTSIEASYWETADIGPLATTAEDSGGNNTHTFPAKLSNGHSGRVFGTKDIFYYSRLCVNWSDVLKLWP